MWRGASVMRDASAPCPARRRRTRARAASRWAAKREGSQIWNLCPCPTNTASLFEPERRLHPVVEHDPPLRIHAQDLARSKKRRREGVARRRERRQRGQQRIDLRQELVAPAVERRRIERRMDVDALEPVPRQRLTEGCRDRDPALGVEAVGEMREEAVHEAPRRRKSACLRRAGLAGGGAHARSVDGMAWDNMGPHGRQTNRRRFPPPEPALTSLGVVRVNLPLGRLKRASRSRRQN